MNNEKEKAFQSFLKDRNWFPVGVTQAFESGYDAERTSAETELQQLREACQEVIPDLQRFCNNQGPGPDKRLAKLIELTENQPS